MGEGNENTLFVSTYVYHPIDSSTMLREAFFWAPLAPQEHASSFACAVWHHDHERNHKMCSSPNMWAQCLGAKGYYVEIRLYGNL